MSDTQIDTYDQSKNFPNSRTKWFATISPIGLIVILTYQICLWVFTEKYLQAALISFGGAYFIILSGYCLLMQPCSTTVKVSKASGSITIINHLLCDRRDIWTGKISQLSEVVAKEVRTKSGHVGYNVYFHFNDQRPIVFFTS